MRLSGFSVAAFAALSVLLTSVGAPADTIYLKNGKQIRCEEAWEEGKEIRYRVAEGIVGIPRSMVSKITREERRASPEEGERPVGLTGPQAQTAAAGPQATEAEESPARRRELAAGYTATGVSLVRHKDLPGALEYFQKAYALWKNDVTIKNLAMTYFELKDNWNAELYFNELLKLDPRQAFALNYLGEISWRKEDLISAESFWERSLAIKEDPEIRKKLLRLRKEKSASKDYENATSRHFLMRYDGGTADPSLVRDISDFLESGYQRLSALFEAYPDSPFVVVLYPRQQFYRVTEAPPWSIGVNDGKIKVPIKGVESFSKDLQEILIHELSHSFIDYKTGRNCPVWLQEGLAQYAEGKSAGEDGLRILSALERQKNLPPITRLNGSFSEATNEAAYVLYVESLSFTEYLIDRYRMYELNQLLEDLGKGVSLQEAIESTYMIPLDRLDEEWRRTRLREE
jgi:tetratricopeptide (TPR) repeat protein